MTKRKDRPQRHGHMSDYDWKAVAQAMGAQVVATPTRKGYPPILRYCGMEFAFHDNGGEINIVLTKRVGDSVPFWSAVHPGGSVGPKTLAYRLKTAMAHQPIDYMLDLDLEMEHTTVKEEVNNG